MLTTSVGLEGVTSTPLKATHIMPQDPITPANTFVIAAPKLDDATQKLAGAKLAAVSEFYEARAKIARLNKELFDKGLIIGHDLMCW